MDFNRCRYSLWRAVLNKSYDWLFCQADEVRAMSERFFLFIVGAYILTTLYVDIDIMIYALCAWLLFEGISDIRLTSLTQKIAHKTVPAGLTTFRTHERINFDAFRAWRLTVAFMLGASFLLLREYNIEVLWFFPWFMGFAILGAGVSGVCPVLLLIRWLGFR
jgi:hypothetical protein